MAWYSVLPSHLTEYETWIIRTFIILAIINIAPWLSLIVYDFLLYVFRTAYHEVPVYGGRARGLTRPGLAQRDRRMSFKDLITGARPGLVDADQVRRRRVEQAVEEDEDVVKI